MKNIKSNNKCSNIRYRLFKNISSKISLKADWVHTHIVNCPKCRKRLASVGKVDLALSIIKSQPHNLDLLMRANQKAVGVLKHSLRNSPGAQKLKKLLPEPKLLEKCGKYKSSLANTAACIAILLLMKTGIFSSMESFQSKGQKVMKNYYASRIGEDLTNEIFS